jgi:Sgf11 (transcriptional regulation protein)
MVQAPNGSVTGNSRDDQSTRVLADNLRSLECQRRTLYPTLYDEDHFDHSKQSIKQLLDHYAVDYFLDDDGSDLNTKNEGKSSILQPPFKKPRQQTMLEVPVETTFDNSCTTNMLDMTTIPSNNTIDATEVIRSNNTSLEISTGTPNVDSYCNHIESTASFVETNPTSSPVEVQTSSRTVRTDSNINQQSDRSFTQPITTVTTTTQPPKLIRDIWGRIPPKEYMTNGTSHINNNSNIHHHHPTGGEATSSMMICTICQQKVGSSLRFASHLDKCLGIGTMSRNNNNNTTSTSNTNSNTASFSKS